MVNALTSNWFVFFPLAVSLFVGLRLAEGSADLGGRSFGISFLRLVIATLLIFAILAVGLRGNPLGVVWLFLVGCFAFILFWKHRRLERSALLLTALQADDEAKQFTVCESFWFENRGWIRRVSAALRTDLVKGKSWWQALEQRGAARGVYERMAVRLVAKYGQSPTSVSPNANRLGGRELLKPLQIEGEAERLLARLTIFSWVFLGLPLVSIVIAFVLPTLRAIMSEFGQPLPSVLSTIVAVADSAATFGWGAALYVLPLGLGAIMLLGGIVWFFPQLMQRWPLRWLCRDYYRTAGFTALAHALEHEQDLTAACQATIGLVSLDSVARTYALAAHSLLAGLTPRDAFRQAGLINRREFEAFGSGFDQHNPTWSLQQLAHWKMERMLRRYWILVQWAVVTITLLLAVIVGTLAVGIFQVLSEMVLVLD